MWLVALMTNWKMETYILLNWFGDLAQNVKFEAFLVLWVSGGDAIREAREFLGVVGLRRKRRATARRWGRDISKKTVHNTGSLYANRECKCLLAKHDRHGAVHSFRVVALSAVFVSPVRYHHSSRSQQRREGGFFFSWRFFETLYVNRQAKRMR